MEKLYNDRLRKVENQLRKAFPAQINYDWVRAVSGEKNPKGNLAEYDAFCNPARELLNRGGKRWRPVLMLLAGEIAGSGDSVLPLVPLVEFPHNGSLVIDDIEDKAEWRRGDKAVHLIYGVDFSINAGNLLYYMPTALIDNASLPEARKLLLYQYYAENMRRLHLGQGFDILWHNKSIVPEPEEYEQMCRFKTGALARLAAQAGIAAAGGTKEDAEILGSVCEQMGVGFQIMDDVVNLTLGNPGKGMGDDIVEGKKSLPAIHHLKKHPEDIPVLEGLFKLARDKGFDNAKAEIKEAIELISSSGAIDSARLRAMELLNSSAETVFNHFGKSEATELIVYMIRNFA